MLSGAARAEDPPAPAAAAPVPAAPAAATPSEPPRDRRLLNGHAFLPSSVEAPIAVSSFGLEVGFTAASATGPTYRLNGDPTGETRTYSWGGMGQAIRFQTAFLDQLVIRGAITTSLASGLDGWWALVGLT